VDYILQLGLNKLRKSDHGDPMVNCTWLIDQLLEAIAENLSDENADMNSFRFRLETFRREILECRGSEIPGLTAAGTLDLCRGQFKKLQTQHRERDDHFADIVLFLRKTLAGLTGDSRAFGEDVLGAISLLGESVGSKPPEDLKSDIARSIGELHRMVAEKQTREQNQFAQLSEQVAILQHKLKTATADTFLDALTGVANRRNFDFAIQRWVIAHEKNEQPFTLSIFALDSLKNINENYGHQAGDCVLGEMAKEIGKQIRAKDCLARYGGGEFVVLSAGMKLAESEKRFSGMLKRIEKMQYACRNIDNEAVTVSVTATCGVAEYAFGESAGDLIARAEAALNDARQVGKSRVTAKRRALLSAFYDRRRRNSIA
jgi:diguanylate cyclase (GGDEF)-like protein